MSSNTQQVRTMSRRDLIAYAMSMSAMAMVTSGCGGLFASGGGGGSSSATGSLVLPNGISATDLQVFGAGDFGTVSATNFTAPVQAAGPSLVTLINPTTSQVALLGMADPANPNHELSAQSSAEAIIYFALGGSSLSGTDRTTLLNAIKASQQAKDVASAIQDDMASNPYALNAPSANLLAAIKSAANAFTFPSSPQHKISSRESTNLLLIDPSTEVDGITLINESNPLGFAVQNVRRRPALAYTYLTGHIDAQGQKTTVDPQLVGQPVDVPGTANILKYPRGWVPVTSATIPTDVVGQDSKTLYEVVILEPVFGELGKPAIFSDQRYGQASLTWESQLKTLRQSSGLGAMMDFILEAFGLGGSTLSFAALTAAINSILASTTPFADLMTALAENTGNLTLIARVKDALNIAVTQEGLFLRAMPDVLPLVRQAAAIKNAQLSEAAVSVQGLRVVRLALVVLIAVGVFELADLIAIAHDTNTGASANLFNITAFHPALTLSPGNGNYNPGDKVSFKVSYPGRAGATFLYHWKCTGSNLVVFDDGTIFDKLEFDSTSVTTTLTTSPSTQGDLTISVEAFDTSGGGRVSVGTAQTVLKKGSGTVTGQVQTFQTPVFHSDPGDGTMNRETVTVYATMQFTPRDGYGYEVIRKSPAYTAIFGSLAKQVTPAAVDPSTAVVKDTTLSAPIFSASPFTNDADNTFHFYNLDGTQVFLVIGWTVASTIAGAEGTFGTLEANIAKAKQDLDALLATYSWSIKEVQGLI